MSATQVLQSLIEDEGEEQEEMVGFTIRLNAEVVFMLQASAEVAGVARSFLARELLEDAAREAYASLPPLPASKGKKS